MLFKPEHIRWILNASPHTGEPKTLTGRAWKRPMAKVGGIYKIKKNYSTDYYGLIRCVKLHHMRLWDMSEEMARKEGCVSIKHYLRVFYAVAKLPQGIIGKAVELCERQPAFGPGGLGLLKKWNLNPMLYWPEFELVDICPGCCNKNRFLGDGICWSAMTERSDCGIKSCGEFKRKEGT